MTSATASASILQASSPLKNTLYEQGKTLVSELAERVNQSESRYKISETVVRESGKLAAFIREEHQSLLTSKDKERFNPLLTQLSDLFVYMAERDEALMDAYIKQNASYHLPHFPDDAAHVCNLFIPQAVSTQDFLILYDEILQFRHSYLCCHLSHEIFNDAPITIIEAPYDDLLSITSLHVTRSGEFSDWNSLKITPCYTLDAFNVVDGFNYSDLYETSVDRSAVDYSVVFASNTIVTRARENDPMQRVCSTAAKLGTDIKIAFIPSERKDHFSAFLTKHGLARSVSVYNLDTLAVLATVNVSIRPIIRSFISEAQLKATLKPQSVFEARRLNSRRFKGFGDARE